MSSCFGSRCTKQLYCSIDNNCFLQFFCTSESIFKLCRKSDESPACSEIKIALADKRYEIEQTAVHLCRPSVYKFSTIARVERRKMLINAIDVGQVNCFKYSVSHLKKIYNLQVHLCEGSVPSRPISENKRISDCERCRNTVFRNTNVYWTLTAKGWIETTTQDIIHNYTSISVSLVETTLNCYKSVLLIFNDIEKDSIKSKNAINALMSDESTDSKIWRVVLAFHWSLHLWKKRASLVVIIVVIIHVRLLRFDKT